MGKLKFLIILFVMIFTVKAFAEDQLFDFEKTYEFNFLGDEDLNKLYLSHSKTNEIYLARLMLNDPANCSLAHSRINSIIRRGGLNPAAMNNLKAAAKVLDHCAPEDISWWLDFIFAQNNIEKLRPFIEAEFLLNEAIMNSRIRLNSSSDSEKVFIKHLLQSYFFPGYEKYGKINYPAESEYAFEKWQLLEKVLREKLLLNPSDVEEIMLASKSGLAEEIEENAMQAIGEALQSADYKSKSMDKKKLNELDTLEKVENIIETEDSDKIGLSPEAKKEMAVQVWGMMVALRKNLKAITRQKHDSRHLAMMLQLIAEPGSAGIDPQLRTFASKVTLELDLSAITEDEFSLLKDHYQDSCKTVESDNTVKIDINCMTGKSENKKSIQQLIISAEKNKGLIGGVSIPIKLVTGIFGEDLEYMRAIQVGFKFYEISDLFRTIVRGGDNIFWSVVNKIGNATPNIIAQKNMAATGLQSSRNGIIAIAKFANGDARPWINAQTKKLFTKISSGITKGTKGILVPKNWPVKFEKAVKSGKALKILVCLGIISETVSLIRDQIMLAQKTEKRRSLADHLGRLASLGMYANLGIRTVSKYTLGTYIAVLDAGVAAIHALNWGKTPYSHEILAKLARRGISIYGGYWDPTEQDLDEMEKSVNLPNGKILDLSYYVRPEKKAEMFQDIDITMKSLVTALYRGHRIINDYVGDRTFGVKIKSYMKQYQIYRRSYERIMIESKKLQIE